MGFFGRETEISTLTSVNDNSSKKYYIVSSSSIGKSELLRQTGLVLEQDQYFTCLNHTIEANAPSMQDIVVSLMHQLLSSIDSKDLTMDDFLEYAHGNMNSIAWSTFAALCSDGIRFVAPDLKQTATALFERVKGASKHMENSAQAEDLIAKHENISNTFIELLRVFHAQGGKAAILIDRVESSSSETLKLIQGIAISLPPTFNFYITINSEVNDGKLILQEHLGNLNYSGFLPLTLQPISITALHQWYLSVNGVEANREELISVNERCEGRTLYLKDWVEGRNIDGVEDAILQRFGQYYTQRLSELSGPAKALIYALSVLPEKISYSFELIRSIRNLEHIELNIVLNELITNGFLIQIGNIYRFEHETVRRNTLFHINADSIKPISQGIIEQLGEKLTDELDLYSQVKLNYQAENFEGFQDKALLAAVELSRQGNIDASNVIYSMMREQLEHIDNTLPIILGEINNNLVLGQYANCLESIRQLRTEEEPTKLSIKLDLLESKCSLRLNDYAHSKKVAAKVPSSTIASLEDKIDALRTINTIYRDIGNYPIAVKVAKGIFKAYTEQNGSPLLESKVYRTLARTYALSGDSQLAIENAAEAVKSAEKLNSIRDLGNAHLAEGESYRFAEQYDLATNAYSKAIELANTTGNVDCLLWSTLGLADTYILNNDFESAEKACSAIKPLLENGETKYPIEFLHWNLCIYSIDFLKESESKIDLNVILTRYHDLKVSWPAEYIKDIHAGKNRAKTF